MPNTKTASSLKTKLSIAAISLLLFLLLLEIALRIIGHVYLSREVVNYGENKANSYVILCIGDSFTWGGRVTREQAYPAYLSRIIKSRNPKKNFIIVNKGKCEYNSSQVLRSLPSWLKEYRPNMVIILVGSSNRFNPWGYNSYRSPGLLSSVKDALDDLRVVKMIRLLAANFKAKVFYWDEEHLFKEEPRSILGYDSYTYLAYRERGFNYITNMQKIKSAVPHDKLSTAWYYYNTGKTQQAITLLKGALKEEPKSLEYLCALAYGYYSTADYQEAEKLLVHAQRLNPGSEFVLSQLAAFYRTAQKFYERAGKLDLMLEYFRKAIELNPQDYENYYRLSRVYDMQSKYDAGFFVDFLQGLLKKHSRLKDNAVFMAYLAFFKEKKANEDKISKWLRDDLDKIVALCKKNNADVIIQNYPVSYPMANNALKDTAERYSLAFVDNLTAFGIGKFTPSEDISAYLFDDSHCTPKGHKLMAENIYKVLAEKKIVEK